MFRKTELVEDVYALVGAMPPGCVHCIRGSKVVIFITGLCDDKCFYCPVSPDKLYHDVMRADEEPVYSLEDIVYEVYRIGADGASITGGDPLIKAERTIKAIRLLKELFGDGFHIHLYTSGRYASSSVLLELEHAGLDEIRFHVVGDWVLKRIDLALKTLRDVEVGVEIPVFPDRVEETKHLIKKLDQMGVKFVNLNELEVSENNMRAILLHGYKPEDNKPVVKGSREAALEIVRWASRNTKRITVHFCPAVYKDRVQMRIRLIRKAMRTAKPYEEITADGMVVVLEAEPVSQALELADKGFGEQIGDKVVLHPSIRLSGARVRSRYPVASAASLPLELQGVTENSNDAS
ncbi:radical SAM protein [Pyrodictium abyssi]|uniref:Radical SAM protein n=1 Tax=Pyrodictium abyssi TaxID=54256 RepID=A0ABM8IWZ2_9CREN|nr:radical SAM protein [Pyrodictium abyssi]